ncbi:MAG: Gfo/Idh/MocA family oxidoreductase [Planctomycetes bacterium]|nr:Gfo/Idh/MocA family oxidoreductase [Planctomycetota bacterium]
MPGVRFGLVGYGAWGGHHARAIASVPGAELVAIAAHSEVSCARAGADHPGARVYADHRAMLAQERLDVADVVLPSHLHHAVAKDVLLSGRHLLLEKPMALSLAQCDELVRLARERQRILAVGHELRLSPLWGLAKELIDSGAIGEPRYALIDLWRRPYRPGSDDWRYDIGRVGSWVLEEPIHFLDLARWYFSGLGEPLSVFASASGKRPDRPELHDNFSAVLAFPRGAHAVVTQTLGGWEHHQTARLTGTEGALWASWSGATDRTFEPTFGLKLMRGDRVEEVAIAKPPGEVYELVEQIARVARAVRDGTPVACTGEDGCWSVAMCLAAQASIGSGRPVPFAEG